MANQDSTLLEIRELKTYFDTLDGEVRAVDGVSFSIKPGRTLGLVGESGCGKSVTAASILRLLPHRTSRIVGGEILFQRTNGEVVDMARLNPDGAMIRSIRGNEISMIFQEPLTSFSPVYTIGSQIAEAVALHQRVNKTEARQRTIRLLEQVGIPNASQRFDEYPHHFSGGMRQRAMIAMALSCNPRLLIADEPTTALDVTIQAQILELMKQLQEELGMAILIITHDLGVIAEMADEVAVMYMGKIVESGDVRTIFRQPLHPYTVGLMRSIPRLGSRTKERLTPIPGSVPDSFTILPGCAFAPRCPAPKRAACFEPVTLDEVEAGHHVRCTLYA
jgi:peptide/nickel transport system ATP-binding protein